MSNDILDWCNEAINLGMTKKEVKKRLKTMPRKVRKEMLNIFISLSKLKGGNMVKKKEDEEEDEEDKLIFEDEEEEEEEEKEQQAIPAVTKKRSNWIIQHQPEIFRIVDPITKKIILEDTTLDGLRLQLQVMGTQYSRESATNTR